MESKLFLYDSVIGKRLKFYRRKRGLTQAALASIIGISAQQLQKYEIGKNRISASRLKQLSELLDVPIDYLMTDPLENKVEQKSSVTDSGVEKLTYYYSMIRSEKIKKLLVNNSAVYVEQGL